ncbi:peptidoglycan/LPS O-acetylase OafA/YrhL [Pseudomonas sp. URMO17WK12:I10]|uniref:acyltransferase family protein n=1 Tax=unclassified Pseudomonas TaxID=196821 RepID=UPI0004856570|nr:MULTISPECIES: acyltransferase [unclassified Pseudomonas]RDL20271.1 peptidoglycan/LPS O-acetylase OafA/YrhL [Pseudomonas sp. LAMO17WK12:I3]RED09220.1 peptidoglycan/LPS O-acetylase OafA/YrhL [Pseudomonas sp. URMO17WK12:I10]SOD09657.1 Peptidoglycan/LPS O-acetylase OafA/YrhL, contains acyltransferase and SGNH-hydrolase domains [Pseudomonas sp. URMO17WK12:I9]
MTLSNPSNRLYTLDVLRGLAALCVVFWHWQHFFYVGSAAHDFDPAQQPFFSTFELLYRHGNLAVQLFFTLSGFVFYWLFANGISCRSLTVSRFVQDRFSRLYPLHIVTFMAVVALQWAYLSSHGTYFVYPFNDVYHAVLNILMVPAWGLEKGWSFNAPVWSVSVEVLLYAIFFIICLTKRWKWPLTLAAIAIGSFLYPDIYKLGSGLVCFFVGGMTYGVLTWVRRYLGDGGALLITGPLCLVAWIWLLKTPAGLNNPLLLYVCYPLLIAALAAAGSRWPGLARRWAWLGDISYSSYLTHFPLQIIFAMAFDALALSRAVFYQGWVMVLFFAVLIPLSLATHRYLERPAQAWLRQRERHVSARLPN